MGVDRGILNALAEHRQKIGGPHFIFSAENPKYPDKNELQLNHDQVIHHLIRAGYDAHSVQGHYGAPEKSIVVYDVLPAHARQLHSMASRLGQESSIYSNGKQHEMVFHHGPDFGKKLRGQGTVWHKTKPDDYYTTLPGGSLHFTHNFDGAPEQDVQAEQPKEHTKIAKSEVAEPLSQPTKLAAPKLPAANPQAPSGKVDLGSPKVRAVADSYAKTKGIKLTHGTPHVKVDPATATKVAQAFHEMPHNPHQPEVKDAYHHLINETMDQFNHLQKHGLKISRITPGMENPYKTSKDVHKDIHENNHLWFYPTESGFGSDNKTKDHPMLTPTKAMHEGKPLLANDVFRIVHDYFGHGKEGTTFGPNGEETAFRIHKQMYSPKAQRALAAETRGQNSWVNFGPHGEHNRKHPDKTIYADQKAGLLPAWAEKDY